MRILNVDSSGFKARLARHVREVPSARKEVLLMWGRVVAQHVAERVPRDTQRLAAAWSRAANSMGASLTVPAIQKSKYQKVVLELLRRQEASTLEEVAQINQKIADAGGPTTKRRVPARMRALQSALRKVERRLGRIREEYGKAETSTSYVAMFPLRYFIRRRDDEIRMRPGAWLPDRRYLTLRFSTGHGAHRLVQAAALTVLHIEIFEPHARVVERNHRLTAAPKALAEAYGLNVFTRATMKALHRRVGWAA